MTTPDRLVGSVGEEVALTRVTEYETGRDGVTGVVRELETVKCVVSSPSESQQQRLEGRLSDGAITVTFVSDVDVMADRPGGRDRLIRPDPETETGELTLIVDGGETLTVDSDETIRYSSVRLDGEIQLSGELQLTGETLSVPEDARIYTAVDVTDDYHPIADIRKLTVVYDELGGREELTDQADVYTEG